MRIKKDTPVRLKSFLGTTISKKGANNKEDYWKLIGKKGSVIEVGDNTNKDQVLVLFDADLDILELENHNPIKNSLWIKKSDLELDEDALHETKLRKEISNRPSFMSDTKWFKFFTEMEKMGLKKYMQNFY